MVNFSDVMAPNAPSKASYTLILQVEKVGG